MCLFQQRTLRLLRVPDRTRIYHSLADAGSILFVFDGHVDGCEAAITALREQCQQLGIRYTGICLNTHRKIKVGAWTKEDPNLIVLNRRNLSLCGNPFTKKNAALKARCEETYGIFLNLTLRETFAEACITTVSHAHLKVGLKDSARKTKQQNFDLCFAYQPGNEEPTVNFLQATEQVLQYLTEIKAKHA